MAKFSKFLPKSEKVWLGIATLGLKNVQKSTSADMIGMLPQEGGQIKPVPMKVKVDEEDGKKYWKTVDNEIEYDVGPQGISHKYIGDVPVGFFVEDPPREVSLLEARIRDAIDAGDFEYLIDGDVTLHEHVWEPSQNGDGEQALADGGTQSAKQIADRRMEIDAADIPKDALIDLSTDSGNGTRISWNRANDILHETATTEEMNRQEQRGELAGAAGTDKKAMRIMKWALITIAFIVFVFFLGPSLVSGLFGPEALSGIGGGSLPVIGG